MWQLDGKRYWAEHNVVVPGDNLPEVFWNAVAMRGDMTLFRQKKYGLWQSLSWREVGEIVREAGMGLLELGFAVGETTSILGNTRQEWLFSDLAVLSCGGISSGIYPTDAPPQVHYLCEDSGTRVLFVEDEEQLDKALEVRERLPLLDWIVVFDMEGLARFSDPRVLGLARLRELGRAHDAAHPGEYERRCSVCWND